jgi:methylamine dehydrogenase heavy chain
MSARTAALALASILALPLLETRAGAELEAEPVGTVLTLPDPGPHWVWVGDFLFRRAALFDAGDGAFLGMLSSGLGVIAPLFSPDRREIYLPETYHSRGSRGERTDLVAVYDAATLAVTGEIPIPPKRADVVHAVAMATLLDDGRFLVVYNYTPAQSVTVVDVQERRFVGEIGTAGCAMVYAAGPRRFAMLCGDGALLVVELDDSGSETKRVLTEPFFDPQADPVTEKGVRHGDTWLFVSFDGIVHPVDVGGEMPVLGDTWSLLGPEDRRGRWRIGGTQHLALHEQSDRLFSLVHQGGEDGHKDPGREVWVYDVGERERVARIPVPNLMAAFLAQQMELEEGIFTWLLERVVTSVGADSLAVTPGDDPLLLMVSRSAGTVSVHDAGTGARIRYLEDVGLAPGVLLAPGR